MRSEFVERRVDEILREGFLERTRETVTVKLKRCPFCGERGRINHVNDEIWDDGVQIWCEECRCQTPVCDELEAAVKLWNARV